MSLASFQIGPYSVEEEIGRGGMGVVYRAVDTRLGRRVAIKTLPPALVSDPERMARFEREARTLATLSHPNIAAIFGVERAGANQHLVLEFVEGETLAERLASGPLPVEEAIAVCAQVAAGIEAAHEAGIVHRDLKPGNIKVTPDGKVKILDFGLAKSVEGRSSTTDLSNSPTVTSAAPPVTGAGIVMGTAGYMSPEQARGKAVDKRADIWALGCVLYECLAGRQIFGGETVSDSIAAILEREPDWSRLPSKTPGRVRDLLARCLEKNPKNRLRDAGDARIELEASLARRDWTTGAMLAAPAPRRGVVRSAAWAGAAVLLVGAGFLAARARTPPPSSALPAKREVTMLSLILPEGPNVTPTMCLSPDGRSFVYGVSTKSSPYEPPHRMVYLRRFDEPTSRPIRGTEDAMIGGGVGMAFSPDGRWLAFVASADGRNTRPELKKVQVDGGAAVTLYQGLEGGVHSPAWASPIRIVFFGGFRGGALMEVPSDGGEAREIAKPTEKSTEYPMWLNAIPGSEWGLVSISVQDAKGWRVRSHLISLRTGEISLLIDDGAGARCLPDGTIVYATGDTLMARPFDVSRRQFTGGPIPVLSGLLTSQGYTSPLWSVAPDCLVYAPGGKVSGKRRLATIDSTGKVEPFSTMTGDFEGIAVPSPDGSMVAGTYASSQGSYELFVYDRSRDSIRVMGVSGGDCQDPVWTRDGAHLVFGVHATTAPGRLLMRRADGSDDPTTLLESKEPNELLSARAVTPDGRWVIAGRATGATLRVGLVAITLDHSHQVVPLFEDGNDKSGVSVSPDGSCIAFVQESSAVSDVVIRTNPLTGSAGGQDERSIVSSGAGRRPQFSRDGKTLYYVEAPARQMAVDVTTGPTITVGVPRQLFVWDSKYTEYGPGSVMPDGNRFLVVQPGDSEMRLSELNVVLNFDLDLAQKLGAHRTGPGQ